MNLGTWKLIIATGTSAAGKSTQAEHFKGRVLTITTRGRREDEAADAYRFLTDNQLDQLMQDGQAIWVVGEYGNRYSIAAEDILRGIESGDGIGFVSITPDYHAFLGQWCKRFGIIPIHIHFVAPDEAEQRKRLAERGDKPEDIEKRIAATPRFESDAETAAELVKMYYIQQATPEEMHHEIERVVFDN